MLTLPEALCVGAVDSVLDVAKDHHLPEWGSVLAQSQSAGRGQMRRTWYSPPGNVYAALRLPRTAPFLGTEAAPALGGMVANVLQNLFAEQTLDIRLKWPNDVVLLQDNVPRKLGGILLEDSGDMLLAGIGINCACAPSSHNVRTEYALAAACLAEAIPIQSWTDPARLWGRLVSGIFFCYVHTLTRLGWQSLAESLLLWRGCAVVLEEETPRHGVLLGLGPSGGARLRVDGHTMEFLSGALRGADGIKK